MSVEITIVLVVLIGMLIALIADKMRPGMILFSAVVIFLCTGILSPKEMLEGFSKYYDVMSPEDKKALLQAMVSFIELYPEKRDDKHLIKTIHFTFPVTYDGESGALFVRTNEQHVETMVLLSRETNPLTVEVRMEVETGEVKEHPTYKRIQEYVQEKYGFKVHTAYIAEVKRMVGLDMHKAPNAVEQRKHEYHPCPPEKVEAIKDALRHFGLIAE